MRARRQRASHAVRSGVVAAAAAALVLSAEATAGAQSCSNPLVSPCIDSDTLWPTPGPARFFGVGGGQTLGGGQLGFGLVGSYQSRPILLRVASPGPSGTDQYVVDDQLTGNFLFAYGVTDRLQLDLAAPVTFAQTGTGTSALTGGSALRDTAVRDLRFGFAYAIVPRLRIDPERALRDGRGAGRTYSIVGRFATTAPIGDDDAFAGERAAAFVPSVAGDVRFGRVFLGADVGARLRPVTQFAGARVGTQITTALGAGYDVLQRERLSVFAEGRAFWNLPEQATTQQTAVGRISSEPNGKHIVPAEWTVGVRSAPFAGGDISFMAGGGGPIPIGDAAITAPRFRFLLGVVYAPTMRDTDGDGVPDRTDVCPDRAGPRSGERPGCPREPGADDAVGEGRHDVAPAPPPPAPPPAETQPAPVPSPALPAVPSEETP